MPTMSDDAYVHGYDARESERLGDQAVLLERLDDAVHGGGRQLERGGELGDAEVTRPLECVEHARGTVDRLDHG